jgi:hypothetical protein
MVLSSDPDAPAVQWWERFHRAADTMMAEVPAYAEAVCGKHTYTTSSHIVIAHLWQAAFKYAKENRRASKDVLKGDLAALSDIRNAELPEYWRSVTGGSVLHAPAHLHMMLASTQVIFNEMRLAPDQRCDPPVLEETTAHIAHKRVSEVEPRELSPESKALSIILNKYHLNQNISVKQVNDALPSRSPIRHNQVAICSLFDKAAILGAGVRSGDPAVGRCRNRTPLRFTPRLEGMPLEERRRLGLTAIAPAMDGCVASQERCLGSAAQVSMATLTSIPCMEGAGFGEVAAGHPSSVGDVELSPDERIVANMILKYGGCEFISVQQANNMLPSTSLSRHDQQAIARIFDVAASLGVGQRVGMPNGGHKAPLRLTLDLQGMPHATRNRLGLQGDSVNASGETLLPESTRNISDKVATPCVGTVDNKARRPIAGKHGRIGRAL